MNTPSLCLRYPRSSSPSTSRTLFPKKCLRIGAPRLARSTSTSPPARRSASPLSRSWNGSILPRATRRNLRRSELSSRAPRCSGQDAGSFCVYPLQYGRLLSFPCCNHSTLVTTVSALFILNTPVVLCAKYIQYKDLCSSWHQVTPNSNHAGCLSDYLLI